MYKLCDSIEPVLNNEKASEPDPVCYIHCNGVSSGCSSTDPAVSPVRNTHCKGASSSCLVTDPAVYPVSYIHGQMPIFFYWFRCTIRFWNSLLSSNNPLLEEIVRADLLLANRRDTWTYQVLPETYQQIFSRSPWCFLFPLLQNKRSLSLYTFLYYMLLFLLFSQV